MDLQPGLVAHWSDIHLHNFQSYSRILPSGANSRLMDGLQVMRNIVDEASALGVSRHIFSGDWHNKGLQLQTTALSPMLDVVRELFGSGTERSMYAIAGNHDMASLDGKVHALSALRGEGFTVFDDPEQIEIGKSTVTFIPYQRDPSKLLSILDELRPKANAKRKQVLVLHTGIEGAEARSGVVLEAGVVPTSALVGWNLVISGHYHLHASGKFPGGEWIIPGSAMQTDASEEGQEKGFVLVNYDTLAWSFHPVKVPQFRTLSLPDEWDQALELGKSAQNYLRLVSTDSKLSAPEVSERMKSCVAPWTFALHSDAQVVQRIEGLDLKMSLVDMLKKYVENNSKDLDTARLLAVGLRAINEGVEAQ